MRASRVIRRQAACLLVASCASPSEPRVTLVQQVPAPPEPVSYADSSDSSSSAALTRASKGRPTMAGITALVNGTASLLFSPAYCANEMLLRESSVFLL